eukprot:9891687-Ditylum_brightwellii.AAC.1
MVGTVQTSVETAISTSSKSTVQMENLIKKSVVDKIARILPGIISTTLKELNIMKPIVINIDTSFSVTISTITLEGNTTAMPKESSVKDISDDNTNTTATSSQDSTSDRSSNQVDKPDETEETSTSVQQRKKSSSLTKAALVQQRKSVCNAKKGIHFDADFDDPRETIIQE